MGDCPRDCSRRTFLLGMGAAAIGCAGPSSPGEGTPSAWDTPTPTGSIPLGCAVDPTQGDGWVSIGLDEAPILREVGGSVPLSAPEVFLDVNVCHVEAGCYVAAWRICPHGACYLDYQADRRLFYCPCHGSEFGEDGALLKGPATRGLTTFPAGRLGESIWVQGQSLSRDESDVE